MTKCVDFSNDMNLMKCALVLRTKKYYLNVAKWVEGPIFLGEIPLLSLRSFIVQAEKNELRDEKQKLKNEKESLEQQLKITNAPPAFFPPPAMPASFVAPSQGPGNKLVPVISYPGVAMWQFMPPAAVDTSQDHVLRPPVA